MDQLESLSPEQIANLTLEDITRLRHAGCPIHYVVSKNKTVNWLTKKDTFNTVLEYIVWDGKPEDRDTTQEYMKCVLMNLNHDEILEINRLLIKGDQAALEALLDCQEINKNNKTQCVLGFDLVNKRPKLIITYN